MDIQQTTDLTYVKVNEIDRKVEDINNNLVNIAPENSSTVSENLTNIKTDTNFIKTNVGTINSKTATINSNVNSVKTKVDEINEKVDEIKTSLNANSEKIDNILDNQSSIEQDLTTVKNKTTENGQKLDVLDLNVNTINANVRANIGVLNTINTNVENNSTKLDTLINNQANVPEIDLSSVETTLGLINGNVSSNNTKLNAIQTKIDTIDANINTVLENQTSVSGGNADLTTIETKIDEITTNVGDISSDVTTINSNVATNKNNINTIKTSVEKIEKNTPTYSENQENKAKLNEILKIAREFRSESLFEEDPFKLDMPYTGRIETNRNPSNYDCYETTREFASSTFIFYALAHCVGPTYNYKLTLNFTTEKNIFIELDTNTVSQAYSHTPGTHNFVITKDNITVQDEKITFHFYASSNIVVHYLKFEVWGNNIILLPKRKKYKISYSKDKILITKIENNNGYYLTLDKNLPLKPNDLNREYVLDKENIFDYDKGYDLVLYKNNYFSLTPFTMYITRDYLIKYQNITSTFNYFNSLPSLTCQNGYSDSTKNYFTFIQPYSNAKTPALNNYHGNAYNYTYYNLELGNTVDGCYVNFIDKYNDDDKTLFLLTNFQGMVYLLHNTKNSILLGYGKNPTGFVHSNDPLKANIYMNDGGYCVKRVVQFKEDLTSFTILSTKIVGTYDAYYETETDIYFVEKDKKLYMFNKSFTQLNYQEEIENNET